MNEYFKQLNLEFGDYIYIQNERGEGYYGTYENEYNSSNETFKFSNHSNGKVEVIKLEKLQQLTKVQ